MMRKRGQQLCFVLSDAYERLVPANHFLRRVSDALDFGFIDRLCRDKYKVVDGGPGRPAEPPVRLFKLLLLMFLYQVKFERELERRANDSVSWRWFCGYAPDESVASHKTLWLFRKRLGPEVFDKAFAHLVEQCISKGLVDRRRYHVDATSQQAAATPFSQFEVAVILTRAMIDRLSSMQGKEAGEVGTPPVEMDDEMKSLVSKAASKAANLKRCNPARVLAKAEDRPYEAESSDEDEEVKPGNDGLLKEFVSLAREIWRGHAHTRGDTDARIGKTSPKSSFCGYLSTAVVEESHGVVLGYHTVAGNTDQGKTFLPAYERAVCLAGKPEEVAADRAFDLEEIRSELRESGVVGHIPMVRTCPRSGTFNSERFSVVELADGYEVLCPCGLPMRQIKSRPNGLLVFRGTGCKTCSLRSKCTTAKDGSRNFEFEPVRRKLQEECWRECRTARHTKAMKRRMATIEPVFGHGKTFHNLGKSIYRSLSMRRIQTAMSFFAIDLEKLIRYAPA
jgi:transposase